MATDDHENDALAAVREIATDDHENDALIAVICGPIHRLDLERDEWKMDEAMRIIGKLTASRLAREDLNAAHAELMELAYGEGEPGTDEMVVEDLKVVLAMRGTTVEETLARLERRRRN